MNTFMIIGKIKNLDNHYLAVEVKSNEKNGDNKIIKIQLKNDNLWNSVYQYTNIGDTIAIKGHIDTDNELVAEKLSFLATSKK